MISKLKQAKEYLDKAVKLMETNASGLSVISQSQKAQTQMHGFDKSLLSNHLKVCLVKLIKSGKLKNVNKELVNLYRKRI